MAFVSAAVGDRSALLLRRPRSLGGASLPPGDRSVDGRPGRAPFARTLCSAQPAGDRRPARAAAATGPAWLAAAAAAVVPWARSATAAALAAALVLSPAALPTLQVGDAALTGGGTAYAARGGGYSLEAASGEVNKDGESVLRWALPIDNKAVRELQASLERITGDLRGLKWGKVEGDARKAVGVLKNQREKILAGVPDDRRAYAEEQLDVVADGLPRLNTLIAERSTEKVVALQRSLLRNIGNVEQSMVVGFPFEVPAEFADKPLLKGRATVQMTIRKTGEDFDIRGTIYKEGKLTMVLDGYNAPVTAGNFVDLVQRGFYNNDTVVRSDGFVVQIGRPDTKDELYVDPDTGLKRTIPLEVFAKGDKVPTYGLTLEDDGRGYAATKLPFSVNGALAQARNEFEPNTGSSQVFWFLFEPDLTPAGRNLLDGRYALFGYVIDGDQFLNNFSVGDKVIEAKVVDGLENLVLPGKKA
ncbi:hypothetical protein MMPV_001285 [Pyropia vietnamensis]